MRNSGYYWIRLDPKSPAPTEDGWEVAYFEQGEGWYSVWDGGPYADTDIEEIDETQIVRG